MHFRLYSCYVPPVFKRLRKRPGVVFETARFGHSRTSPRDRARELTLGTVIFQSVFFLLEEPVQEGLFGLFRLSRFLVESD